MDMTAGLKFPKPEPRVLRKKRQQKREAKNERACREIVRARDKGTCRIPGCKEHAVHLHHIVYRSKSRGLKWLPSNLVSLCADHHGLLHAGKIHIEGNADEHLTITGDISALKFKL